MDEANESVSRLTADVEKLRTELDQYKRLYLDLKKEMEEASKSALCNGEEGKLTANAQEANDDPCQDGLGQLELQRDKEQKMTSEHGILNADDRDIVDSFTD